MVRFFLRIARVFLFCRLGIMEYSYMNYAADAAKWSEPNGAASPEAFAYSRPATQNAVRFDFFGGVC